MGLDTSSVRLLRIVLIWTVFIGVVLGGHGLIDEYLECETINTDYLYKNCPTWKNQLTIMAFLSALLFNSLAIISTKKVDNVKKN